MEENSMHLPECFIPYDIPNDDAFLFSHIHQYVSLTVKIFTVYLQYFYYMHLIY